MILPCTDHKPYTESVSWRYVAKKLNGHSGSVDLAAIDCITNPRTGEPFGIVMKDQQWRTVGLDEFPDKSKVERMKTIVSKQLERKRGLYRNTIAYVNVRSYWEVLWDMKEKFQITMLPRLYHHSRNWNSLTAGISPRGAFYRDIDELIQELNSSA